MRESIEPAPAGPPDPFQAKAARQVDPLRTRKHNAIVAKTVRHQAAVLAGEQ